MSFVRMDGECFSVKVLQVIHGYPPRYNAGSEVYTQTLCHALAGRCEVCVFTREEDSGLAVAIGLAGLVNLRW